MRARWEISGENGAALGPNVLALDALLPLVKPLVFRSQSADTFGYFLPIDGAASTNDYLPDRGQFVTLWRDGQPQFRGRVTGRKYIFNGTGQGWEIELKGGWHELERIPLISDATPTYDLPQQNLKDSISQVLGLAIANGAQLQIGNIATMMDCFPLQFRAASIAATMSDLLRFAQDAMTWVDYSTTPPTLNITRRAEASSKVITLGRDSITQCELSPDDSSVADRVDFIYAIANATGIVTQVTQSAGVEQPKKRIQVVTAESGFDQFTQRATATQQQVMTVPLGAGLPLSFFIALDARLAEIEATYPSLVSTNFSSAPLSVSSPFGNGFTITSWTFPQSRRVSGTGASPILTEYMQSGQWQEWMASKLGIQSESVSIEQTFWVLVNKANSLTAAQIQLLQAMEFFYENSSFWYYRYRSAVNTRTLSVAFPTTTALRDPGDYPLTPPPSGIADYLASALSAPSYDGEIVADGYQGYERNLGRVVNVVGGPPELESCRAMTREEEHDLQTGQWTLRTGQSTPDSGLDLLSRFRRLSAR